MSTLELSAEYHPQGFAAAGLTPNTLSLRWRSDASMPSLAARIEAWEAERHNSEFSLKLPARTRPELAFEISQAYVALREWFPSVMPECVNLASPMDKNTLATAWTYATEFPLMREMGLGPHDDVTEIHSTLDSATKRRFTAELLLWDDWAQNPHRAGVIDLSSLFSSQRRYRALIKFWEDKNARAIQAGRPVRMPALRTSSATMVFVHEFGHLVDAELIDYDREAAKYVYGALSYAVFRAWPHSDRQWRYHLWNYPTTHRLAAGAEQGGRDRRSANRLALRAPIGLSLTRYAAASRDEAFAEAFALMFCGDTNQRRALAPFRDALRQVGLMRTRRPKRQ